MSTHAVTFDKRLLALSVIVLAAAFFVPPVLRNAVIAIAIAIVVLAPLPRGTRGVVLTAMVGLATGIASINLFAVGIFQRPITQEFGWSQAQYSAVLTVGTVVTMVSSVFIGRLFDRGGVRKYAIVCTVLLALALMSLYFLTPSLWHFYGLFALVPIIGAGTSSVAYSRVVARWFDQIRGQAFGAALAGIGIGGAVLSAASQFLIAEYGWRVAYVGLGGLLLVVTLPLVVLLLRDSPADVGLGLDGKPLATDAHGKRDVAAPYGYTAPESRRQPRFWALLVAFTVLSFAIGGVLLQLVPILIARGVTPAEAASIQGALGLALIVGRAFAGFLMDRLFAPYVAAAIIAFPVAGVTLLALGATGGQALFAAVCVGLAAGAELDVLAYLITRYFGNRGYAENYGWLYAAWTAGSGVAPVLTALVYDRTGSHTLALWIYVAMFTISAVLVLRLGAYPKLRASERDDVQPGATPVTVEK